MCSWKLICLQSNHTKTWFVIDCHSPGVDSQFLKLVFALSENSIQNMSKTCPKHIQNISQSCPEHVQTMSNACPKNTKTCPTHVQHISKTYPTHVQQISKNITNTRPPHVQHISKTSQHVTNILQTHDQNITKTFLFVVIISPYWSIRAPSGGYFFQKSVLCLFVVITSPCWGIRAPFGGWTFSKMCPLSTFCHYKSLMRHPSPLRGVNILKNVSFVYLLSL